MSSQTPWHRAALDLVILSRRYLFILYIPFVFITQCLEITLSDSPGPGRSNLERAGPNLNLLGRKMVYFSSLSLFSGKCFKGHLSKKNSLREKIKKEQGRGRKDEGGN